MKLNQNLIQAPNLLTIHLILSITKNTSYFNIHAGMLRALRVSHDKVRATSAGVMGEETNVPKDSKATQ